MHRGHETFTTAAPTNYFEVCFVSEVPGHSHERPITILGGQNEVIALDTD